MNTAASDSALREFQRSACSRPSMGSAHHSGSLSWSYAEDFLCLQLPNELASVLPCSSYQTSVTLIRFNTGDTGTGSSSVGATGAALELSPYLSILAHISHGVASRSHASAAEAYMSAWLLSSLTSLASSAP